MPLCVCLVYVLEVSVCQPLQQYFRYDLKTTFECLEESLKTTTHNTYKTCLNHSYYMKAQNTQQIVLKGM